MSSDISLKPFLIGCPAAGIAFGLGLHFAGFESWANWVWALFAVPVLLALLVEIAHSLRRGNFGLDIVAALSMTRR
jgi:hypothetical protein